MSALLYHISAIFFSFIKKIHFITLVQDLEHAASSFPCLTFPFHIVKWSGNFYSLTYEFHQYINHWVILSSLPFKHQKVNVNLRDCDCKLFCIILLCHYYFIHYSFQSLSECVSYMNDRVRSTAESVIGRSFSIEMILFCQHFISLYLIK